MALITRESVSAWMKMRHERPLFMIDIALPRNIEASVNGVDNVYLYNIDDLKEMARLNVEARQSQIEECSALIQKQTQHFMEWLAKEFGAQAIGAS